MGEIDNRVPDLLVERLRLDELGPDEARALRERLGDEADEALQRLGDSDEQILEEYPPAQMAWAIRRQADERAAARRIRSRRVGFAVSTMAVAAAAAVALLLAGPWTGTTPEIDAPADPALEATRIKGLEPSLRVYRSSGDSPAALVDHDEAAAGDVLQLSYVAAGRLHGVILSMDGNGAVSLHHPETEDGSTGLQGSGEVALPHAFELDDAPHFERFVLVTGDEPLDVERVLDAAQTGALGETSDDSGDLPADWQVTSITLMKAER